MKTNTAKSTILQKLRSAHANSSSRAAPGAGYNWPKIAAPMAQFKTLLSNNHAVVIDTNEAELAQTIRTIIQQGNYRNAVASERARTQYPALVETTDALPAGRIEAWKEFLFNDVEVGITCSSGAIATTGTIILRPGADEPRSLSLVPPCHIVIVREETLYNDLAEVMDVQNWQAGMPTNMVLVSGPSKTADIQQTLAYGAHGPRELFVVLVQKNPAPL